MAEGNRVVIDENNVESLIYEDGMLHGIDEFANRILSDLFFELEGEIAEAEQATVPHLRKHIERMIEIMANANHVAFVAEELFRKADAIEKDEVRF